MNHESNFIRTGDRTWVTLTTTNHNNLLSIRSELKRLYPTAIVQIIEDVQYINHLSIKSAIQQAFSSGVNSIYDHMNAGTYFMQITFLNDLDNSDFIMQMSSDVCSILKQHISNGGFYNSY